MQVSGLACITRASSAEDSPAAAGLACLKLLPGLRALNRPLQLQATRHAHAFPCPVHMEQAHKEVQLVAGLPCVNKTHTHIYLCSLSLVWLPALSVLMRDLPEQWWAPCPACMLCLHCLHTGFRVLVMETPAEAGSKLACCGVNRLEDMC